jgi:hypothetical protein
MATNWRRLAEEGVLQFFVPPFQIDLSGAVSVLFYEFFWNRVFLLSCQSESGPSRFNVRPRAPPDLSARAAPRVCRRRFDSFLSARRPLNQALLRLIIERISRSETGLAINSGGSANSAIPAHLSPGAINNPACLIS